MAKETGKKLKNMSPEKRREYEKRKRRVERNRKILGICLCAFLVVAVAVTLSLTVFFKIDTIEIAGKTKYDETQIINASGISKGTNLFLCDLQQASDGVCRNLPYISGATVKRKLPSTVIIELEPTSAYMAVKTVGGTALADKNGKILEFVSREKLPRNIAVIDSGTEFAGKTGENIFEINTADGAQDKQKSKANTLKKVIDALGKSKIKDVTSIIVKSPTDIHIMYQNRLDLNIGSTSEIEYKLKAAYEIIQDENDINSSEKADIFLSDTDNIYVSPEQ